MSKYLINKESNVKLFIQKYKIMQISIAIKHYFLIWKTAMRNLLWLYVTLKKNRSFFKFYFILFKV